MPRVSRRSFFKSSLAAAPALAWTSQAFAADPPPILHNPPPLILAPENPSDWPAFRTALAQWRDQTRLATGYNDALYRRPDLKWAASCFACCFLMACDETFYNPRTHTYRVQEFLDHGRREFGGYDAVVLWHAYPRIGTDERNQFDFYRDLPGGVLRLREVVQELHAAGVRVFLDYNPWDAGTRREPKDDLEVLALFIQALDADGIFLDTLDRGAEGFRAALDAVRPGVVLESEIALPVERVFDHHLSWGQWFADGSVPGVLRNKWFEPRHLQHQTRRWDPDHTGELHTAWMNGSGVLIWENVFGSWMGWSPRDRSLLRSLLPIQRRFARLFTQGHWTPLVPTRQPLVFANLWELDGVRLWTLVNRSNHALHSADLLAFTPAPGTRHDDLVAGSAAILDHPERGLALIVGDLAPRGIGCLVEATDNALGPDYPEFLRQQRALADRADASTATEVRPTTLAPPPRLRARRRPLAGMVAIPAARLTLHTELRVRECGFYESVPAAGHALGDSYRVHHQTFTRSVALGRYAMDLTPVTNAQFAEFLRRSGYRPDQPQNFLKHWGHGHAPYGHEDHPVVYVSLEDARAYARWANKRLPTEEEWQYAAQGPDARVYPWGPAMLPNHCNDGAAGPITTPVTAHPAGRSPFGIHDLCGNVWEWTESERSDGRTRFCLLKGGSYYAARGSNWYFDGGPQPNARAAKFLLHWPGLDRCATIGFRCAADLTP